MALIHHASPLHSADVHAARDFPQLFLPVDPAGAAWRHPETHLAVDRTWLALRHLLRGTAGAALFAPGIPDAPASRGVCGVVGPAAVRSAHDQLAQLIAAGLPLDDLPPAFASDHVMAHVRQAEQVLAAWTRRGDGAVWVLFAARPLPLPGGVRDRVTFPLTAATANTPKPPNFLAA